MTETIPILDGIAAIRDRYDAFIVDLWGVVHDGVTPYPGVIECLQRLRADGKQVCLLSNAPRRVGSVVQRLAQIGVPEDCWDAILSSGEAAHLALAARDDDFHQALGERFLHLGPERDADVYEAVDDVVRVDRLDDAEFVLNTGIDDPDERVEDHAPLLEAAAARKLPMICANPDIVVIVGGKMQICAGALAQHYETLGGTVFYHGKPHPPVYRRCFELLGRPDPARVLAIGDSFHTDMAGAAAAGIDGLFVIGGIHGAELRDAATGRPDAHKLAAAAERHGLRPAAAVERLNWDGLI
ncbi:TIGR01459 family HAD-type hydrolase [Inquilinus sp.]|uniref:TIGR01459 family HAD-type hydrolase n=1 Tax=Inquilinus sp. TaxID=1932117 RepID=UPI0031D4B5A9